MRENDKPMQHEDRIMHHYLLFAVNMALSLIVMYFVMFSMIDGFPDFQNNINTLYMALTMVAPMGIIMLATMGGMYNHKGLNAALYMAWSCSSFSHSPERAPKLLSAIGSSSLR